MVSNYESVNFKEKATSIASETMETVLLSIGGKLTSVDKLNIQPTDKVLLNRLTSIFFYGNSFNIMENFVS